MAILASRLKERYDAEVRQKLLSERGYSNIMMVPRVTKVIINVGVGEGRDNPKAVENAVSTLSTVAGQKPVVTKARKSISNFTIRQGMKIGAMVTLRGMRMWHFLDKLFSVTMPRIRDFRGISPKLIDKQGNLSIGFKEYIAFPEIRSDEIERLHGVQVTVSSTAKTREEGLELFKRLGFPFHG